MNKEEKAKDIQTAGELVTVTNHAGKKEYGIFEQVLTPQSIGEPFAEFAYYEQPSAMLTTKASIAKTIDEVWVPMKKYPFMNIYGVTDYESLDKLYQEIYDFVYEHIDFTDEAFYHVVTSFILASWRFEDFNSVPYLMFLGEFASGKTRSLEVLAELCYRAIKTSSISTAGLVRLVEKYRVTLLVDETDTLNNESKSELIAILNSGYKIGDFYIRANQDNNDLELWKTFGFKALAGTQDFVKTLNSRCIEIPMERATRKIRKVVDKDSAAKLRMKLLDYRFKKLFTSLPDVNLPFENGRNHELFTPLVQIVPEKFRRFIIDYGLKLEDKRKIEEETSFEGDVLRSLLEVIKNIKSNKFYAKDLIEPYARISDIRISDMNQEALNKLERSLKTRIGNVLGNKFHFTKERDRGYRIEKMKIYRMMLRFTPDLIFKAKEYLGSDFEPTADLLEHVQTDQPVQTDTNKRSSCTACTGFSESKVPETVEKPIACKEERSNEQ